MSVQSEITRIESAKTAITTAIEGKGVTVPEGTKLDALAALVESIETGGGNFATGTFTTTDDIASNVVINHNLGVKPKFIIVLCTKKTTYSESSSRWLHFYYLYQYSSTEYGLKYLPPASSSVEYASGYIKDSENGSTGAWYGVNVDETTFTLKQANISNKYGIGASTSFFWLAYGE